MVIRCVITLLLSVIGWSAAQTVVDSAAPRIEAVTRAMLPFVERGEVTGIVTMIVVDGQTRHLEAIGTLDVDGTRPMTDDAIFCIASMTKPITAAAALILCDEGKLELDDPVSKILPEFERHPTVTLRHLLTHTSGLFGDQRNVGTLAETARNIARRTLAFEPGTRWTYGPGISVVGRMIEVAAQQPYEEFLAQRLFEPLGMKDSTFITTLDQDRRLAQLTQPSKVSGKQEVIDNWLVGPKENRSPNPSGGLFSTARDVSRFYEMLLNLGMYQDRRILSEASVREMTRPQTGNMAPVGFVPGSVWGLGVGMVGQPQEITATLHEGSFGHGGAFGTQAWADPHRRAVYILLIQRMGLLNSDASPFRRSFQEAAGKVVASENDPSS